MTHNSPYDWYDDDTISYDEACNRRYFEREREIDAEIRNEEQQKELLLKHRKNASAYEMVWLRNDGDITDFHSMRATTIVLKSLNLSPHDRHELLAGIYSITPTEE